MKLLSFAINPPLWFVVLTVTGAAMVVSAFAWFGVSGEFDRASALLRISAPVAVLSAIITAYRAVNLYRYNNESPRP